MPPEERDKGTTWTDWESYRPLGPIVVTFLAVIGWLVFILLYALFWSGPYSLFQNAIVTLVTLVIMGLVIGLTWTIWGMGHARRWMSRERPSASG
ncbi:MAG TPA: hypothetical protein VKF15_05780 [Nitrososphaerales archaeon]|nr:hypothetical protein [Nitrososphaerales archaeon]